MMSNVNRSYGSLPYHLFSVKLSYSWVKVPHIYTDNEFYEVLGSGDGYLPLGMRAFHFNDLDQMMLNPVIEARPVAAVPIRELLATPPEQPMKLKDKRREESYPVHRKFGDLVLAETDLGWKLFHVDGIRCSLITALHPSPITLKEASGYVQRYHRHNTGPKFHKYSVCLRVAGEPEPVGVVIVSTPKARHQMDGRTLEINRCCADSRYSDVCSKLYGLAVRAVPV